MRAEKNLKFNFMKKEISTETNQEKVKGRVSSKKKKEMVLALLRGESIEELCRVNSVAVYELTGWRDHFLEKGAEIFKRQKNTSDRESELERIIGRQQMEIELLKKKTLVFGMKKGNS